MNGIKLHDLIAGSGSQHHSKFIIFKYVDWKKMKNTIVVGQISENSQGSEIIIGMGQKSPYVTLDAGVETPIEFLVVNGYEPPNAKQRLEVPSKHGSLQYAR